MSKRSILLTGASGQLGSTFCSSFQNSKLQENYRLFPMDSSAIDFLDENAILHALKSCMPSVVVNCAAFTAVDAAEEHHDRAKKVNSDAVRVIARWAKVNMAKVIHISTDFVFDGAKKLPYLPSDKPNPLSVYGRTKLDGEKYILELMPDAGMIVRTSWLYSEYGTNFLKSMLRLMSEKDAIRVVGDQYGCPTSTRTLTNLLFEIIGKDDISGVHHWNDGGNISWYEFAAEIQKQGLDIGLLERRIPIFPIETSEYPAQASRPLYSVLDCGLSNTRYGLESGNWKKELSRVIDAIVNLKKGVANG